MSGTQKKSFSSFLSTPTRPHVAHENAPLSAPPQLGVAPLDREGREPDPAPSPALPLAAAMQPPPPERIRQLTSTGRVRTHSANRQLPGVTLRLAEDRWERLKMLSLQERRPIQEILGDAMEVYMKVRGLPW